MTLQSSGAISLSNIASEMGGSTPHSLSEYYKNGGLVGNHSNNPNVPTSGTISFSNFYGANNTAPANSFAVLTRGIYTTVNQKFQTSYTGYNLDSSYMLETTSGIGSGTDLTIQASNGTQYTITQCYIDSFANAGWFAVVGNVGFNSFQSVFGSTGIKWNGTTIMTVSGIINPTLSNLQGGSISRYQMTGQVSTVASGSNQNVEFL